MSKLIELSQQKQSVGSVADSRNGSIMQYTFYVYPRDKEDDTKGYRVVGGFSFRYPEDVEQDGKTVTIWKDKKWYSDNDFLRKQKLAGRADDLLLELRQQLRQELKSAAEATPSASATPSPSL